MSTEIHLAFGKLTSESRRFCINIDLIGYNSSMASDEETELDRQ